MPDYRLSRAAQLLGVSDDTVRRWVEAGKLTAGTDDSGHKVIAGTDLAAFARRNAGELASGSASITPASARNKLPGIVTNVVTDQVMAQVDIQCGPYRIVSLMSREAVEELGLARGVIAVASVKATSVVVAKPQEQS
jgi:molybdopterin-binding protein